MEKIELRFFSDDAYLDGRLYTPSGSMGGSRYPLVVACSGFLGIYRIHPERFARYLTDRGFVCYGFDFRGRGDSGGHTGRILLEEYIRDIRAAVSVASASQLIDGKNVFLLGWAMGAGLALDAVRELSEVKGILCINGLYDGADFQSWHRTDEQLRDFRQWIRNERLRRARSGVAEQVDPFEIYPLDDQNSAYVSESLERISGYDTSMISFELAESLMRWSVLPVAPSIEIPLFIAHGTNNQLHPKRQADALISRYGGEVAPHWLANAGHSEWMSDHNPLFQRLCDAMYTWLRSHCGE